MTARPSTAPSPHGTGELHVLLVHGSAPRETSPVAELLARELPEAVVTVVVGADDALAHLSAEHVDATLVDLSGRRHDEAGVVQALRASLPDTLLLVVSDSADDELALVPVPTQDAHPADLGPPSPPGLAASLLHALERHRIYRETRHSLELARGLLDAGESPTCAVDQDGLVLAVNSAWRAFMSANGGRAGACATGANYLTACDVPDSATHADAVDARAVAYGLRGVLERSLPSYERDYPCHGPDQQRWFTVQVLPAELGPVKGAVVTHVDVTARHDLEEELAHQTLHDGLTDLPNRVVLTNRLDQALVHARARGRHVAVAFVDLDHFKRVNDSFGHDGGDDLLVQVGQRLRDRVRPGDTLGRYAGDEFVAVWRDLASDDEAVHLADQLMAAFDEPFDLVHARLTVAASVGLVLSGPDGDAEALLLAADAAMYDAKAHGGGQVRHFHDALRAVAREKVETEVGLGVALEQDQLVLHYQPVVDLRTGQAVGVEALARWAHPERGLLGPDEFIGVAESSGLILQLGAWVLRRASQDLAGLSGPQGRLDVAVNLSARQLSDPDVVGRVRRALAHSGLDPQRLVLEVTESALVQDEAAASAALDELSTMGVRIAVDDFGTGHSSLLYLRRYPIRALKLDRAFVAGLGSSRQDEAICASVVGLADAVGAMSVGEGVETTEQYAALRALGCDQAQGFLWSPAVSLDELPDALRRCRQVPVPTNPPRRRRGRTSTAELEPAVAVSIAELTRAGASLFTIAAVLNRDAAPNPTGVRWSASSVGKHVT